MVNQNSTTAATLSRRAFLTTAPAVALAAAPAVALARPDAGDELILALWRRWDALCEQRLALELEVRRLRAAKPADVIEVPCVEVIGGGRYYTLDEVDAAIERIPVHLAEAQADASPVVAGAVEKMLSIMEGELRAGRPVLADKIAQYEAWKEAVGLEPLEDRRDEISEEIYRLGNEIARAPATSLAGALAKADVCVNEAGGLYDPLEGGDHEALGGLIASLEAATGLKATAPARCKLYAEA